MYALAVNFSSPREWREAVSRFAEELESRLGPRLRMVVALPSPGDSLYDSNVLVVLSGRVAPGDYRAVREAAPEGSGINPLVVPEGDEAAVEAFELAGGFLFPGRSGRGSRSARGGSEEGRRGRAEASAG